MNNLGCWVWDSFFSPFLLPLCYDVSPTPLLSSPNRCFIQVHGAMKPQAENSASLLLSSFLTVLENLTQKRIKRMFL